MIRRSSKRLLLLGGTGEAVALAEAAHKYFGKDVEVITSLAGRTRHPLSPPGTVRMGGFGGVDGLTAFLRDENIDAIIDATHPFAAQISRHARLAAESEGLPRLILARPPWQQHAGDKWTVVEDVSAAAAAVSTLAGKNLGLGLKIFLTIGSQEVEPFLAIAGVDYILRQIDPVKETPPANVQIIIGRGPFTREKEIGTLTQHKVQILVSKASGGTATYPKIEAARTLEIPVIMISRPPVETGDTVTEVSAALEWIEQKLTDERHE